MRKIPKLNKAAVTDTINDSISDSSTKWYLTKFNLLEEDKQRFFFEVLDKITEDILIESVENSIPFHIPFIGKIKRHIGKIYEVENKTIIANKYGYNSFDDIPKDIYEIAAKELETLVKVKLAAKTKLDKEYRKTLKPHPYKHKDNGKILHTLDLKKIKQQLNERKNRNTI